MNFYDGLLSMKGRYHKDLHPKNIKGSLRDLGLRVSRAYFNWVRASKKGKTAVLQRSKGCYR